MILEVILRMVLVMLVTEMVTGGMYVGGCKFPPVSFDPGGDGKSEVVSDVEVTGPDQRGFLL